MKKKIQSIYKKVALKLFILTKNKTLYGFLMCIGAKLFYSINNRVKYMSQYDMFGLYHKNQLLLCVNKPYLNFSKNMFYERCMTIFCKFYLPKIGDVVIDIGAGDGLEFSFFMDKIGNTGKLYCIEANEKSVEKLNILKLHNKFENSFLFHLGIANYDGDLWLEESDNYRVGKTNFEGVGYKITCKTLDSFILDNAIEHIDFLKVNIEGAELEMIDGMNGCIKKIKNIAVSCHDFLNARDVNIKSKVVEFLKINEFEVYEINTGNQVLDSWIYAKRN